jgi:hypothetical protein
MPTTIERYKHYASEHGAKTQEGDYRAANGAYDKLLKFSRQLIQNGDGRQLLCLFEDPNAWVQLWAASHALEIDEVCAVAKLEQLAAAHIPLTSMSAEYTLQSWRQKRAQAEKGSGAENL